MKRFKSISVNFLLLLVLIANESLFAQIQSSGDFGKFVNLLKLTAAGNGYSDQTIVIFIPEATPGFDSQFDAYKLPGSNAAPQLYSIIPGCNLAINALPEILINLDVQLGFKVGVTTNYSITASEMNSFDPSVSIYLDDTKDGVLIDLKSNPVYSFSATPNDPIQRFKLYFRYPVNLDLKVFLEGCFNENDMSTNLNQAGDIPLSQPYNIPPWNYDGTENVTVVPNPDIVDWVLVEIRDTTNAAFAIVSTRNERKAGFLLKNGSIVDIDGINPLRFKKTINENMYVVICQRNHLGILSSSSPIETSGTFYYDFTTGADKAYGGLNAQKEIAVGIYGMFAGDANSDGIITELDKNSWVPETGFSGYKKSDSNLDGQTDNRDKNDLWLFNIGATSQIPE